MQKYRTSYRNKVELLEVIKETPKQIVYKKENGREERENKASQWSSWHDTKKEAVQYLINKEQTEIDACLSKIAMHNRNITNIKEQNT